MTDSSKSTKIRPDEDYDEYLTEAISTGTPASEVLSKPEFDEMIKALLNPPKPGELGFVSPAGQLIGGLTSAISPGLAAGLNNPRVQQALDIGVDAISEQGQRLAANIAQRLSSGEPFVRVKKAFGDTGGNSGDGAGGSGKPGSPFNVNRMNFNPKPVQVRLDTGIRSKGYGDYYPDSKSGLHVLEITQAHVMIPSSLGSKLAQYFNTVITFNFQNDAQMNVSFNVNAVNKFTPTELRNWMNRYAHAYAVYVSLTSIIAYCNEPLQQNEGIRRLRSMITPQILDDLSQLGNMLDGTPAPPKFREFIHFIYGAPFKVGNLPGAQVRMILPFVLQESSPSAEGLDAMPSTICSNAINNLFLSRDTTALIARVSPSWIPGKGMTAAGAGVCENSPNWHTLWENLPFEVDFGSGNQNLGPVVSNENEDGKYGSSADVLDGAITALWNGYNTSSSQTGLDKYQPGTVVPIKSGHHFGATMFYSNRISFSNPTNTVGSSKFILVSDGLNQESYMRCETYTITQNGAQHQIIWPGREIINNINIAAARQTSYELFSQMFDMKASRSGSMKPQFKGTKSVSRRRTRKMRKEEANSEFLDE